MNPILAAVPTFPILPSAPSAAQSGAAQTGTNRQALSGFTALLAAAQGLPATDATSDAGVQEPPEPTTESGGISGNKNFRLLAAQAAQFQKKSGGGAAAGTTSSIASSLVSAFASATIAVAPKAAPTKVLLSGLGASASPDGTNVAVVVPQTNFLPAASAAGQNLINANAFSDDESQPDTTGAAPVIPVESVLAAYSLTKVAAPSLLNSTDAAVAADKSVSPPVVISPGAVSAVKRAVNQAAVLTKELRTSSANTQISSSCPDVLKTSASKILPTEVPENQGDGIHAKDFASESSKLPAALSPAITPLITAAAAKQTLTAVIPLNLAAGNKEVPLPVSTASAPTVSPSESSQGIESAGTEPTLPAGANINIDSGQLSIRTANANAGKQACETADTVSNEVPAKLVAQVAVANSGPDLNEPAPATAMPGSSISTPTISNSSISNLPAQVMAAQVGVFEAGIRAVALKGTISPPSPTGHGAVVAAGTAGSSSFTAPFTVTTSGKEALESDQNPFSIFFSSPGPGTESAASILPKVILPSASSTVHDPHTPSANLSSGATANSQTGSASGGSSAAGASQAPAPQNGNDTSASTGNMQIVQAVQHAAAGVTSPQAAPVPAANQSSASATFSPTVPQPQVPSLDTTSRSAEPSTNAPGSSASGAAAQNAEGLPQMAQMVNRAGQSEMRIGMSTSAFGSVEVRTIVHANDVGLVIGSEKGDLRTLLGNELPAITNTLQQQNLRLNSVNFMQGFAFSNNASGGGGNFQQRPFAAMQASSHPAVNEAAGDDSPEVPPTVFGNAANSLSILA